MLLRELELGSKEVPFVVVGVLRTDGPTAIKQGNKAIILADGSIEGWVGGHCTENEIVQNALGCLKLGESRSLNLTTCQGGRMDVYLEPYLPKRKLLIFGHVPIATALCRLGHSLNFNVTVIDENETKEHFPEADYLFQTFNEFTNRHVSLGQTFAVIATMGNRDEEYAEKLSRIGVKYVGIVAGRKRANDVISYLKSSGLTDEQLSLIKSPAGIYIRAVTAEEIALSIMAEITELSRTERSPTAIVEKSNERSSSVYRTDPVCGMLVATEDSPEISLVRQGKKIYFCSDGCRGAFEIEPEKYMISSIS